MPILIKRYANRKLYNTDSSRYITLKGIAKLLEEGHDVKVIDNETGEDITQSALGHLAEDQPPRAEPDKPDFTFLSQILARGGDALYTAIKKSVEDGSAGIGDFHDRFRDIVDPMGFGRAGFAGSPFDRRSEGTRRTPPSESQNQSQNREAEAKEDLDRVIRSTLIEVLDSFDLPRRRDIDELAKNLERIAEALDRLEEKS